MPYELYFCLELIEAEHEIVAEVVQKECDRIGVNLLYYRPLKSGHVPMIREVKVIGLKHTIGQFKRFMRLSGLDRYINTRRLAQ